MFHFFIRFSLTDTHMSISKKKVTFGENTTHIIENISDYVITPRGFRMTLQRIMSVFEDMDMDNTKYMTNRQFFLKTITKNMVDRIVQHPEVISIKIHKTQDKNSSNNLIVDDLFTMLEVAFECYKSVKIVESDEDMVSFKDSTIFPNVWIDYKGKLGGYDD